MLVLRLGLGAVATWCLCAVGLAQEPDEVPVRDVKPMQPTGETVTIQREALRLIDPQPYDQPLHLAPGRALALAAVRLGTVRSVRSNLGEPVDNQQVAVELETTELDLQLARAEADLKVTEVEVRQARASNQRDAVELAEARFAAAQAGRELAKHLREQALIRAPFAARVLDVHVAAGQVVRAGDPLVTIGDTSKLTVEIPVDRKAAAVGKPVELRIDDQNVTATIDSLRPLATRFEPLRNLVPTAISAIVVLNNADARYQHGQSVFAPLVPRAPIIEIPNAVLSPGENGTRKVQVVREDVVRDIEATVLAAVGVERCFVSGPFREGDELILSLSKPLADGTRVRSATALAEAEGPAGARRRGPQASSTASRVNAVLSGRGAGNE